MGRVAILDKELCRPKDCGIVCIKFCPKVRTRVETIKIPESEEKPVITEVLCTGCGICIKKCPFEAITIVNLPEELEGESSHRFGQNLFKLYRLPMPQLGIVTGLLGRNGTGKTTALQVLAGELKPNMGDFNDPPEWLLQTYFEKLSKNKLKISYKPQYVDKIPKVVKGKVKDLLTAADEKNELKDLIESLQLNEILDRQIGVLSGGELQRVAIAATASHIAEVYIFDEPSSHLDVSQRIAVSKTIRKLAKEDAMVIVAEHDLAMLDYLSDQICLIYGEPGAYGIVSRVHGLGAGINTYLEGFISDENMRFRSEPIKFHFKPARESKVVKTSKIGWKNKLLRLGDFELKINSGEISQGEVVGILGANGIGKTTFIKFLAGINDSDKEESPLKGFDLSYKPQYISTEYSGEVRSLFSSLASSTYGTDKFETEFVRPLGLSKLLDRNLRDLSGGELQRIAITACLCRNAQIYLLDEPSAYLDVEERLAVAKLIRRIAEDRAAFVFVVEHDIVAQDFISDRLMIFDGDPGVSGLAHKPVSLRNGMNSFLSSMSITFRRDPDSGRPRVNKLNSKLDRSQKDVGEYYYVPATSRD
jgi:ATP-binding cassette subfamily E protein 1